MFVFTGLYTIQKHTKLSWRTWSHFQHILKIKRNGFAIVDHSFVVCCVCVSAFMRKKIFTLKTVYEIMLSLFYVHHAQQIQCMRVKPKVNSLFSFSLQFYMLKMISFFFLRWFWTPKIVSFQRFQHSFCSIINSRNWRINRWILTTWISQVLT